MWGKGATDLQFSLYKCSFRVVLRHVDPVLRKYGTRVELSWKQKFQLPLIFPTVPNIAFPYNIACENKAFN